MSLPPLGDECQQEVVRNYSATDIQPQRFVAWDHAATKRFSMYAPGVRPICATDKPTDIAGVAAEFIAAPTDPDRPAKNCHAATMAVGGFAWIACEPDVTGGEPSLPAYFETANLGDELGVVLEGSNAGRVRRRQPGDRLVAHAVYVTADNTTVLARLALT
jgi:hypothetical protein